MLPKDFYEDLFNKFPTHEMNCDIYEEDGVYNILMDLPGFNKEDIKVECHKGTITISASKDETIDDKKNKKYLRHERHFGKVERSFYLGDIDEDLIDAHYKDGTIIVKIPMQKENPKKIIEIK